MCSLLLLVLLGRLCYESIKNHFEAGLKIIDSHETSTILEQELRSSCWGMFVLGRLIYHVVFYILSYFYFILFYFVYFIFLFHFIF